MTTAAMVRASFSVVGKALSPFTGDLLKDWASSVELGTNVQDLERELLSVKAVLEHILGKEIHNSALKELLDKLQELGYDADDVLDEMDYFRIQDELDGTFHAADHHAGGCARNLLLNLHHTAKAVLARRCLPTSCFTASTAPGPGARNSTTSSANPNPEVSGCMAKLTRGTTVGKCFPSCSSLPSVQDDDDDEFDDRMHGNLSQRTSHTSNEPPKLRFNRVDASNRMQDIVKNLRLVRGNVSAIIATIGSDWITVPNIAESRPITTSESIQPKLYGRDSIMTSIIHDITKGPYCDEHLTVIPIVGLGGIGKTTLAQHIYKSGEVQEHFDVRVWTCVSLNFNVHKLIDRIGKAIPKLGSGSQGTAKELIEQTLEHKRLLLVLDDMWDCSNEDEWKQLLLPFQKSKVQGNIIIVTTRIPAQAHMVRTIDKPIYLQSLDHKEFKELFLDIVFGDSQSVRNDHSFLHETGDKIVAKLHGSPLAAKTVGRLLKNQPDLVHWTRVLESKEWEKGNGNNDIMPALKLSYDYLPVHLKQCFSYCALFPQDHIFEMEMLIHFWIGLDVLQPLNGENERVEDIGLRHLTQLVNHGFLENHGTNDASTCYILHDLLHELARKVSSHECLSIESSQMRSLQILPPVRHLSINIDDKSVVDRLTIKSYLEDFNTSVKGLKVERLRSLLLFGEYHGCFVKAYGDLFREAKALRVVFLSQASYGVEDLLHNFYNLVHLRYLRIQSLSPGRARFPNKISRFYHMMVLDAKYCDIVDLPRDMNKLVKLRHFLVQNDNTHSSIIDVGKLKSLQELRRFVVKQDDQGFKLWQIGQLVELCGSLCIDSLENVQVKEEADEAKMLRKLRLHELILCWNTNTFDSALEDHVLERLKPSSNLLKLSIRGHHGATCPSWLGTNLYVKSLESLCLDGVAWKTFPPLGELCLVNAAHEEICSNIHDTRFQNLRSLELLNLPSLKKWVVQAPCQLFPFLEVLTINGCSQLVELSFSHFACCQQRKEANVNSFPRLSEFKIGNCPQLLPFPLVPWTETTSSTDEFKETFSPCLPILVCENVPSKMFGNLRRLELAKLPRWEKWVLHAPCQLFPFLEGLAILDCSELVEISFSHSVCCQQQKEEYANIFPRLSDLKIRNCPQLLSFPAVPWTEAPCVIQIDGIGHPCLCQLVFLKYFNPEYALIIQGKGTPDCTFWNVLAFHNLSRLKELVMSSCPPLAMHHLKMLSSLRHLSSKNTFPLIEGDIHVKYQFSVESLSISCSASAKEMTRLLTYFPRLLKLNLWDCEKITGLGVSVMGQQATETTEPSSSSSNIGAGEGIVTSAEEGLLLLPPKLQSLDISGCTRLSICSLQGLSSLQWLTISVLTFYSSSHFPFPNSLESLSLYDVVGMETLAPLSNLMSLTSLTINRCGDLRCDGLLPLLTQGHLTKLYVTKTPNFFVDLEPLSSHEQELRPHSSNLQELCIDDVGGVTATPICGLLCSSLSKLDIYIDQKVDLFTEEQEALLFVNSIMEINLVFCKNLQYLPVQMHTLSNLKRLQICGCKAIQMLPTVGLPSSLQRLIISACPEIQSLPKDFLPTSLQTLVIRSCPAIRSLPKVDDLPSSLRELDVSQSESDELKRQCRKFIGSIPVVRTD